MILVASTMASFVCDRDDTSLAWLYTAEELRDSHPDGVQFFAALETDARGLEPFQKVIARLEELGGTFHTYSLDDGREAVDTGNRLDHICMGRNVITNCAVNTGASHILFLDADMQPPGDAISRLLELNWPLTGGNVGTYRLGGPDVEGYPLQWNVQEHMNTAGFLLVAREVFRKIRWRWDHEDGMTDDPCFEHDVREYLGIPTYVRHSVEGVHMPLSIVRIEDRFPGRDMKVYRKEA